MPNVAHLAEDRRLYAKQDEALRRKQPRLVDHSADWSSDPMEQLMARQERERAELRMKQVAQAH